MKVEKLIAIAEIKELEITGATLLTVGEAEDLPLRLRKYNNWWWLRSPGYSEKCVTTVFYGSSIGYRGSRVDYDNVAVRPALEIKNLESSALNIGDVFVFGGKKFGIIDRETAFCLEDIGTCAFRKDWKADDANYYEKSDVKKFINDWFEEASK